MEFFSEIIECYLIIDQMPLHVAMGKPFLAKVLYLMVKIFSFLLINFLTFCSNTVSLYLIIDQMPFHVAMKKPLLAKVLYLIVKIVSLVLISFIEFLSDIINFYISLSHKPITIITGKPMYIKLLYLTIKFLIAPVLFSMVVITFQIFGLFVAKKIFFAKYLTFGNIFYFCVGVFGIGSYICWLIYMMSQRSVQVKSKKRYDG